MTRQHDVWGKSAGLRVRPLELVFSLQNHSCSLSFISVFPTLKSGSHLYLPAIVLTQTFITSHRNSFNRLPTIFPDPNLDLLQSTFTLSSGMHFHCSWNFWLVTGCVCSAFYTSHFIRSSILAITKEQLNFCSMVPIMMLSPFFRKSSVFSFVYEISQDVIMKVCHFYVFLIINSFKGLLLSLGGYSHPHIWTSGVPWGVRQRPILGFSSCSPAAKKQD